MWNETILLPSKTTLPVGVKIKHINILCNFLFYIYYDFFFSLGFIKSEDTLRQVCEAAIWLCGDLHSVFLLMFVYSYVDIKGDDTLGEGKAVNLGVV